jgi:hypothetical protein
VCRHAAQQFRRGELILSSITAGKPPKSDRGAERVLLLMNNIVIVTTVDVFRSQLIEAFSHHRRHCCKVSDEAAFVLFKGLTFQKLCLPGAFRPGDHHNKMLRPGLCVVHASPQYL